MEKSESPSTTGPCCPHCFTPVQEAQHFCPRCERPLTGFAATDPIKSIFTEGQLYRGATRTTRPVVLIGMWLLCVPAIGMGVVGLLDPRGEPGATIATVAFVFALYGAILYRVTANYFRARKLADASRLAPPAI